MKVEYLETTFDGTACFAAWVDEHAELVGNGHTRESALDDLLRKQERLLSAIRLEVEGITAEDLRGILNGITIFKASEVAGPCPVVPLHQVQEVARQRDELALRAAAAPDLLRALEALLPVAQDAILTVFEERGHKELKEARDVVAKARNQTVGGFLPPPVPPQEVLKRIRENEAALAKAKEHTP